MLYFSLNQYLKHSHNHRIRMKFQISIDLIVWVLNVLLLLLYRNGIRENIFLSFWPKIDFECISSNFRGFLIKIMFGQNMPTSSICKKTPLQHILSEHDFFIRNHSKLPKIHSNPIFDQEFKEKFFGCYLCTRQLRV